MLAGREPGRLKAVRCLSHQLHIAYNNGRRRVPRRLARADGEELSVGTVLHRRREGAGEGQGVLTTQNEELNESFTAGQADPRSRAAGCNPARPVLFVSYRGHVHQL